MGNLGGMELVVILLVALIVLGPTKLPEAARQIGRAVTELRRISGGFQKELREAINEPMLEAQAMARGAEVTRPKPATTKADEPPDPDDSPERTADAPSATTDDSPERTADADDG